MMRRLGLPKTDEERRETHQSLYGETELPARGTGLVSNPGGVGGMASVFTPSRIILVGATTATLTSMGSYALAQKLRGEDVGIGRLLIVGLGSGCLAGLTSFLVTRFIK